MTITIATARKIDTFYATLRHEAPLGHIGSGGASVVIILSRFEKSAARHNYPYNGGKRVEPKERRHCVLGYVVALANEKGGRLVLGMEDKRPHDVCGSDFAEGKVGALEGAIYDAFGIRVQTREEYEDGRRVLVIEVPSRPIGRLLKFEGVALMRVGEDLHEMSDAQMLKILSETEPDFSAKVCEGLTMTDLDDEAIGRMKVKYAEKNENPRFESAPNDQVLRGLHLMVDGKLTYAALILLGKREAIKKWLPQNNVVVEYRFDPASIQFDARKEFRMLLFVGIDEIWNYLNQPLSNPMSHIGDAPYIFDIRRFTQDTVREGVLNAITHRSMQIQSDVVIKQSPKDIVITNAGGFPLGVDLSNILTVNSNPRQKLVAEVLQKTGLVEKSGQGVDKMFALSIMESKPLPDYSGTDMYQVCLRLGAEIRDEQFVVFVRREQAKRPVGKKLNVFDLMILYYVRFEGRLPEGYNEESLNKLIAEGLIKKVVEGYTLGDGYTPCDTKNVVSDGVSKLTERQQNIFSKIVADPLTTIGDMAEALKVSTRTIDRDVEVLKKLGYIRKSEKDNRSPWLVLK